jgi:Helix-turn-helix domain
MNVDKLASAYRQGATLHALARATGLSYGTVRNRLVAAGVELRSRGPRPLELDALANLPTPRPAGLRRARAEKLSRFAPAARRANPRTGRAARSGRSTTLPAPAHDDDELVELVTSKASQLLAERGLAAAVEQLSDDEVWAAMQELRIAMDGGRGVTAPTGSTRGVRRNPTTGETERF